MAGRSTKIRTKEHGGTTRMKVAGKSNSAHTIQMPRTPGRKEKHGFDKSNVPGGMNSPLGGPTK